MRENVFGDAIGGLEPVIGRYGGLNWNTFDMYLAVCRRRRQIEEH